MGLVKVCKTDLTVVVASDPTDRYDRCLLELPRALESPEKSITL